MVLTLLGLFVGILAIQAGDNVYSRVMCEYLTLTGTGTNYCTAGLTKQTNKYCDGDSSFFTETEIGKFIDGSKMPLDEIKVAMDAERKVLEDSIKDMKQMCFGDKTCEKMVDAAVQISIISMDATYDITAGGYAMANTFNLGALCLGAYPEGHFSGVRPIITKSILDRLEDLCNGSIDMMESYLNKIADAAGKIDNAAADLLRKEYKTMFGKIRDLDLCPGIARSVEFAGSTLLAEELSTMIAAMFVIPDYTGEYHGCISAHQGDVSSCNNAFNFDSMIENAEIAVLEVLELSLKADEGNFSVDDKAGFDVYGASKKNPEYKEMTKELPSGMTGGDGLAGWAIALIVIAVLLVLGGVGVAVYFLVIKPKKSQKI